MQSIKGSWRLVAVAHVYWTPGFYYPTVQWVTRSFSYPVLKFRWVPGYLLWNWIPIPGHFEPYIAWQRASIRVPVIVWKYHPGFRITYYTYRRVEDKPIVNTPVKVYAASNTTAIRNQLSQAMNKTNSPYGVLTSNPGYSNYHPGDFPTSRSGYEPDPTNLKIIGGGVKIFAGGSLCILGAANIPDGFGFPMIFFGQGFVREGITDWKDVIYS